MKIQHPNEERKNGMKYIFVNFKSNYNSLIGRKYVFAMYQIYVAMRYTYKMSENA